MVQFLILQIRLGRIAIEDVPEKYREEVQKKFEEIFLNLRDYFRIDFYNRYAKTGDQVYTKIISKKTELEYMKEQSDQKQKKSDDSLLGWLFMLLLFSCFFLFLSFLFLGFPVQYKKTTQEDLL